MNEVKKTEKAPYILLCYHHVGGFAVQLSACTVVRRKAYQRSGLRYLYDHD